ncbi:MAG: putative manganese transporter [Sarcina sp.]
MKEILDIFVGSASDSYIQVGVFVGAVLIIFALLDYKSQGKMIKYIEKSKKIQPFIGAFLGLTPGCGGAIIVMPLFIKGTVSYGTVIATLIATMGDSAFVLMTTRPIDYLIISFCSYIIGVIVGYIVDYFDLEIKLNLRKTIEINESRRQEKLVNREKSIRKNLIIDKITEKFDLFLYNIGYVIYWSVLFIGLVLGILLLMQIDLNKDLGINNLGLYFGLIGMIISLLYVLMSRKKIKNCNCNSVQKRSFKDSLRHNAYETASVNLWVMMAYLIYEVGILMIGGEHVLTTIFMATGVVAVIVGALIGLIPGCGPQIIFVTLYAKGFIPFAALLANAISQDGDALLPLMARDKKSPLWATIITTIPALAIGIGGYLLERYLFTI